MILFLLLKMKKSQEANQTNIIYEKSNFNENFINGEGNETEKQNYEN